MKKILVAAFFLLAGTNATFASERERPIAVQHLPALSKNFLSTHFEGLTLAYAVEESGLFVSGYEVVYTDGTQVDFDRSGEWTSVDRRYVAVPEALVPEQIRKSLISMNYQNFFITKIEHDRHSWEVKLSNGLEIKFDRQFRVVEIDD